MNFQAVTAAPSELGESPFWHPLERLLYWVDIPGRKIMRARADGSSAAESWAMPSEPGCIAPAAKGGLVIALRDGIYRASDWGGALRLPVGQVAHSSDPVSTAPVTGAARCVCCTASPTTAA